MIKVIVVALLATLFIGCSVRVLNFDDSSNNEPVVKFTPTVDNAVVEHN